MHLKDPRIFFTSNTLSFNEIKILHVSGTLSYINSVQFCAQCICYCVGGIFPVSLNNTANISSQRAARTLH